MSMLPAELTAELSQLLQALQSSDNTIRSQAEEHLQSNWTSTRPEVLLMGLAETIQNSPDIATRSFAAVIFRRISSRTVKNDQGDSVDLFLNLQPEQAGAIRQKLLDILNTEPDRLVRNKISDAVAEIARQYTDNNHPWPELLGILFQLSQDPEAPKRETAFRIFNSTPSIIETQNEESIQGAFNKGFKDDAVSVRLAAIEAFCSFLSELPRKQQTKYFGLIPEVLNILPPIKESQDSEELSRALICLIDLAETSTKMFKPLFHNLVVFSISVIQDKELDDICRQNALELMATFADYAPSMCRKDPSYTNDMITQCLSLMTDLGEDDDDAADWLESDDLDQDDSDQNHIAGEQTMDRLANKLGGQTILAPTFHWLPRMMSSMAWRDRHAALMAISAISEGCRELMIDELGQVLDIVIPALTVTHPRVRWAGCNAIGQMSTDFAPIMQKKYGDRILKAIIPVLESPESRVKSHAAAALVNFCEEAEKDVLEPYLDDLLSHLLNLLNDKRYVQEQALSTIATVADAAEAAFTKYYDTLMPILMTFLQRNADKETRLLRAKAMECATLIALAVGKERLGRDAIALVEVLATIQTSVTEADDPQAQYLMHCWGRMCRVLGSDFLPFLPNVIPPLMELAMAKADIQLIEEEEHIEQMQQEEGWELVPVRGKMLGIRTSTMDDKRIAIELLVVYAQVLEGNFSQYVPEIMEKIALTGLAFFFHDPVRSTSARLIPQLLNSYKKAYGEQSNELAGLWDVTVDKILDVLALKTPSDTLADLYQGFYESVDVIGSNSVSPARLDRFTECVRLSLEGYLERVVERAEEKAEDGPEDAEDESEETLMAIEDDQTLLSDINKAIHIIFKHHGARYLSHYASLVPVHQMFLNSNDVTQRQWGLCVIDDVIEYSGADSDQYASLYTQHLINGCQDPSPALRQAAAYGVGVTAIHGGPSSAQFVAQALPYLFQVTEVADARSEENIFATENACAAIAKILHYKAAQVPGDVEAIKTKWVDTLPIVSDEEAAPYAYAYLAQLIEQNHPAVTSQPEKTFVYVAKALEADMLVGITVNRVVASVKNLLLAASIDPTPLMSQFSPAAQQTIMNYFK